MGARWSRRSTLTTTGAVAAWLFLAACNGGDNPVAGSTTLTAAPERSVPATSAVNAQCSPGTVPTSAAVGDGCTPGLQIGVEAAPTGQPSGETLRVTVRLTNDTDTSLMTGIAASELLIDGQPDPSWRLALNGTLPPEIVDLPAGQSAELSRELRVTALTPGSHEVVVRMGGQSSPPVQLEVS